MAMVAVVASRGVTSLSVTPVTSLLPGLFLQRRNFSWGSSRFSFPWWPDVDFRSPSIRTSRSFCRKKNTARVRLQGFSGLPCRAEEQSVVPERVLGLKDDEDNGAPERLVTEKIWMRKQSKTRALGINKVVLAKDGQSRLSAGNNEGIVNRRGHLGSTKRWFPHRDAFQVTEGTAVSSEAVMEMLDPFLSEERKQRIESVVDNRTYSICTVVEGLSDVGNVSAICRTADAMGFQSIHVISSNHTLRYKENHRTSAGAEKWLDMENWDDTQSCITTLKARGYRIAVTHIADDTVSIHDMDWTVPTAIVLGNEHRGISEEVIALSDVRCSIPMAGMVESFNVSVAAAILMHHAMTDRLSRVGFHGDLSDDEKSILLAVFYMRHRDDTKDILKELVSRNLGRDLK